MLAMEAMCTATAVSPRRQFHASVRPVLHAVSSPRRRKPISISAVRTARKLCSISAIATAPLLQFPLPSILAFRSVAALVFRRMLGSKRVRGPLDLLNWPLQLPVLASPAMAADIEDGEDRVKHLGDSLGDEEMEEEGAEGTTLQELLPEAVEKLECLEEEAMAGSDVGREPEDYDRRAHLFDESSRVFRELKDRHDRAHGADGEDHSRNKS